MTGKAGRFASWARALPLGVVLLAAPWPAFAWRPVTKADLPYLPEYCTDHVGPQIGVKASGKDWAAVFGPKNWAHMHHYCFGINHVNHAIRNARDKRQANYLAGVAVNEIAYVFSHGDPEHWPLRAEAYMHIARARVIQGQAGQAGAALEKAVQSDPNFVPAYVALFEMHMANKDKASALKVVEQGLQHVPDSRHLASRFQTITGKAFVPPPQAAKPTETPAPPAAAADPAAPAVAVADTAAKAATAGGAVAKGNPENNVGTGGLIGN